MMVKKYILPGLGYESPLELCVQATNFPRLVSWDILIFVQIIRISKGTHLKQHFESFLVQHVQKLY